MTELSEHMEWEGWRDGRAEVQRCRGRVEQINGYNDGVNWRIKAQREEEKDGGGGGGG